MISGTDGSHHFRTGMRHATTGSLNPLHSEGRSTHATDPYGLTLAATALTPALLFATPAIAASSAPKAAPVTAKPASDSSTTPVDKMSEEDLRVAILRILADEDSDTRVIREATDALNGTVEDMRYSWSPATAWRKPRTTVSPSSASSPTSTSAARYVRRQRTQSTARRRRCGTSLSMVSTG